MWHQVYSYREASGLVRCIYSFVQGRRVLGIWFAPHFGSQDEQFACAVETWIDSLLASGYSLYQVLKRRVAAENGACRIL